MTALQKITEDIKFLADKQEDPIIKIAYGMALIIVELHLSAPTTPSTGQEAGEQDALWEKLTKYIDGMDMTPLYYFKIDLLKGLNDIIK